MPTRALAVAVVLALGCALPRVPQDSAPRGFRFPADAFAFSNETIWEYDTDPSTGRISWRQREPRPPFALRCGAMARSARQFYAAAVFEPAAPTVDARTYADLVQRVLASDPRRPPEARIVIPGFANLRTFSAAHEALVQAALPGPLPSYLQRGNWRMIFPFTSRHQRTIARDLVASLARGWPPIVHVLRYPRLTINHMVLVFDAEETPAEIRFRTYDPNDAGGPVLLTYDRATQVFSFGATPYFPGGPVKAYEVYDGLLR